MVVATVIFTVGLFYFIRSLSGALNQEKYFDSKVGYWVWDDTARGFLSGLVDSLAAKSSADYDCANIVGALPTLYPVHADPAMFGHPGGIYLSSTSANMTGNKFVVDFEIKSENDESVLGRLHADILFVDLRNGTQMDCAAFQAANSRNVGGRVSYRMNWSTSSDDAFSRQGFLLAATSGT